MGQEDYQCKSIYQSIFLHTGLQQTLFTFFPLVEDNSLLPSTLEAASSFRKPTRTHIT